MKWIIVLVVVAIAAWLWSGRSRGGATRVRPAPPPGDADLVVPCAHCGAHVPQADAVAHAGRLYCCEAHRDRGPRDTR